jgi:excisionase family DNA binding protein
MSEPSRLEDLLNVPQAAAYLGKSEHTIRAYAKRRAVRYHKVGWSVRFDRADLDDLVRVVEPTDRAGTP